MAKKEIEKKGSMPTGVDADEPANPEMKISDYASHEEAVWAAREFLRKQAQEGLNRRLGINPKEIVGVMFRKSWRNYFADGRVYGFSKKAAAALVKAGVAFLDGVDVKPKKESAQVQVDAARARRAEKKEAVEFEKELKAEEDAKAKKKK